LTEQLQKLASDVAPTVGTIRNFHFFATNESKRQEPKGG
jgi:hypothetical protein